MDAADFNEDGGSFILDGVTLDYASADLETDTLALVAPLVGDHENGEPLSISPLTYEKQAVVVLDDFDESLTVVIPHALHDRLAEGMREDFNRESVTVELEGNTWILKNVYGLEPVIDGQYLENVVADDVIDGIITEVKLANDAVTQAKIATGAIGSNELIAGAVDAAAIAANAVTNAAIAAGAVTNASLGASAVTAGKIASGAVRASELGNGAVGPIALTPSLNDTVMQRFTDGFEDPLAWQAIDTLAGASWSLVSEPTAPSGGTVAQVAGRVALKGTAPILYDPSSLYRLSVRVRCSTQAASGVSSFYAGLMGYTADKTTMVNRFGANVITSQYFPAASNRSLPASDGWITVTGYVKGRSASPTGAQALDMQSPTTMHDNVRYIVPMVWLNYSNTDVTSVMQVDSVTVEVLRTGVVTANELAANSVTAGKILAGEIGTTHLAANAVTAGKIAALAVQAGNIAAGAIQTGDLAANAITAAKIAGLTITSNEIAANAIIAGKIATGAVTADKIDANAINGKTITGATIQTAASGARLVLNSSDFTAYNSAGAISAKLATVIGAYGGPGFATYKTNTVTGTNYYSALTGSAVELGIVGQANPGFIDYSDLGSSKYALEIVSGDAGSGRSSSQISLYSETGPLTSDADIDMTADNVRVHADLFANNIQTGTVSFTTADLATINTWSGTKNVVFSTPFNTIPTVILTCSAGGPAGGSTAFSWTTAGVTATGFGVRMLRGNNGATTFSWIAIST
ncbi:hypothetical protein [Streptomyces sp. B1I3]|uniref:hypothetical protein n=1 Tax=Streptomyces sp. B1I3 TaxID=3042264 RepID=UPI0027D80F5B|nr:hypothetical protein [Streptomyces sp. B1I3]